jgi:hypothetical protein
MREKNNEDKEKEKEKEINENIIVICPTCKEPVLIEKLNCCIFRHAILHLLSFKLLIKN